MTMNSDQDDLMLRLRRGELVALEGCWFLRDDSPLEPGDWYVAKRNTGPHLLTCREVNPGGFIVPEERAYCFDLGECVKVREIEVASDEGDR